MGKKSKGSDEAGAVVADLEIALPDSHTALNKLIHEFSAFAERHDISRKVQREMHIVFDEVVSNIIRHGYEEGQPLNISVSVRLRSTSLEAVVMDDAKPFNLLELTPPRQNPHERGIGGLGVHLVRRLTDDVSYERVESSNKVTLEKKLGEPRP